MWWVVKQNWLWALLTFLLGAGLTWFLLRHANPRAATAGVAQSEGPEREPALADATAPSSAAEARTTPVAPDDSFLDEPPGSDVLEAPHDSEEAARAQAVSQVEPDPIAVAALEADDEQTTQSRDATATRDTGEAPGGGSASGVVPVGRYGEGSADALPDGTAPPGFTIKANVQSRLFHTPDSPYYGRTKADAWFRTEDDAERAGFRKHVQRRRK